MSKIRYCYPKFKVFIYGVQVTEDVISIRVNEHEGDAPNTCHITLLNKLDKYTINTSDMMTLYGITTPLSIPWLDGAVSNQSGSMGPSNSIGTQRFTDAASHIISPKKRDVIVAKSKAVQKISLIDRKSPTGNSVLETDYSNYYGTSIKKYPIVDGESIFHSNDSVRVAMRDPYSPNRWYWHFAGFVSDQVRNIDENNTDILTIVAEDPTKLLRYTRVFLNPGIIDANVVIQEEDIRVQSFYSNFLRGLTLPEIVFTLFFGPDKAGTEKILERNVAKSGVTSNLSTRLRGIGHFDLTSSSCFTFGPAETIKSADTTGTTKPVSDMKQPEPLGQNELQTWQSLIDHEVQPSDMWSMAVEADRLNMAALDRANTLKRDSDGKLNVEAVIDYIGEHWEQYPVDGGKIMMLLPNSLGADNSAILINDIIQTYPLNSEWHSAAEILSSIIKNIQFVMYATPKGDIVIEPPLFDFDPDDFGLQAIPGDSFVSTLPHQTGHDSFADVLAVAEIHLPGRDRGPYGAAFVVSRADLCGSESAQIDEKVHTLAICPHNIVQNWPSVGNTSIVGDLAVIRRPDLIPIYGTRPVPITPPGYIASSEAAMLLGEITLNRLNADANTASVRHLPNLRLWLNRPIYYQHKNCLGTTKQITHNIIWGAGGDMSTTSDVYAIRTWNGDVSVDDPTQPIFTTIGGYGSAPLNYAVLFKKAPVPKKSASDTSGGIGTKSDALPIPDWIKNTIKRQ